jgi:hypothetical protein
MTTRRSGGAHTRDGMSCIASSWPMRNCTSTSIATSKGIENGWEKDTPKVRCSALQFGDREAIDNIVFPSLPIPGTEYKEFFLQNGTIQFWQRVS